MDYELKTEQFRGPLYKLLELIEERKLEISKVSLAEVTDDFLKYLKSLEQVAVPVLADFIVIASRLVFLKSRSLLLGVGLDEEEIEIKDLEERLRTYREIKPAMKILAELWHKKNWEISRPYLLTGYWEGVFYPGKEITAKTLASALRRVLQGFQGLILETETIKEKVITLEEKIQEVVERLKKETEASFGKLSRDKARREIIIIFLAILHLAHEQLVNLEQKNRFSDILIRRR